VAQDQEDADQHGSAPSARPGPKRPHGAPSGPEDVREALLDAAERLFADHGVAHVSMRQIAEEADVQLALIWRYVGKRDDLIDQVYSRLTAKLVADLVERPLQPMGFERQTVMGRWTVLLTHYALTGKPIPDGPSDPVDTIARTIMVSYGLDETAARIRAAQVVGSALGWRIFEPYLLAMAHLDEVPVTDLREDLTAIHRRIGASPWPTVDPDVATPPTA